MKAMKNFLVFIFLMFFILEWSYLNATESNHTSEDVDVVVDTPGTVLPEGDFSAPMFTMWSAMLTSGFIVLVGAVLFYKRRLKR